MTFDAWETGIRPSEDYLMHWGIRGMKHGRNRYQNPDGTWTEEGLERRRKREGFGESKKVRKLEKKIERSERRKAHREARAQAQLEREARRRKNDIRSLTDEELHKKINRLKMEQEYKELSKSPIVKAGENLIKSYLESKDKKLQREMDKANLVVRDRESKANLAKAKAAKYTAQNDLIDNIFSGKGKKKAKKELIEAKAKNQVRGAIRKSISNIISKEGQRIVNDMGPHSLTIRAGRKIKKMSSSASQKTVNRIVSMLKNSQYNAAGIKRPKGASNYTTAGAKPIAHPTSGKRIKGSKGWK